MIKTNCSKKRVSRLQFEPLESRLALAGNVTVALAGAADLKITGDAEANDISISLDGTNWKVEGNSGTTVTFNGAVGTANVPEPQGSHFRNVTIDLKTAGAPASPGADAISMTGLQVLGNLTVSGKNGGVVKLGDKLVQTGEDTVVVVGKTAITFGAGLSAGNTGSTVDIAHGLLGLIPAPGKKGKDLVITTGINDDRIVVTDTDVGGNLTINAKDGNNTVALLGTRLDSGGVADSKTFVDGNVGITTGAGNDTVGLLGIVVGGGLKEATGKGNDFQVAGGVVIKGATSIASTDGNDLAVIGLRDVNGNPLPAGGAGNQMLGKVKVNLGNDNDLAVANATNFGNSVTATLGAGDDTLAENGNTFALGIAAALKACRGGSQVVGDNLVSSLGSLAGSAILKTAQFEKADLSALPGVIDAVFNGVSNGFRDILLAYGIDIGTPPDGNSDPDDQISEASGLAFGNNQGTLDNSVDVDMRSLNVTAGQVVTFDLASTGFDGVLRLFDAGGNQLAIAELGASHGAQRLTFTFQSAGTFYLAVSSFPNFAYSALDGSGDQFGGGAGTYTLTVTDGIPPPPADPDDTMSEAHLLNIGDPATSGEISEFADIDMYKFVKVIGQAVSIVVTPTDQNLDVVIRVFNLLGQQVVANMDQFSQGLAETINFSAGGGGTLFIGVSSYSNESYDPHTQNGIATGVLDGDTTGPYTIQVKAV